jgi:hypothetical protein
MKRQIRLTSQQQQEQTEAHVHQQAGMEFETPEAMLRHDALHTPVPPTVEARLRRSLAHERPLVPPSFWKKFFKQ